MNLFSISQLEQFSGIKAHTIRIWEQRYGALHPSRSEGNTRHYNNSQLRRLLNIVSLMKADYKVSELCSMSDEKMFALIEDSLKNTILAEDSNQYFVNQLIIAGMNYDEIHFDKIFSNCVLRLGVKDTYINVIYPMLSRIGIMWSNDSIPASQEHFISNLIRQKLFTTIDGLPPAKSDDDSWVLFLPENEFHEIGLLMCHYIIKLAGKKSIYLGPNLPLETLSSVVKQTKAKNLYLFLVHNDMVNKTQEYIDLLSETFKNNNIYISGNQSLLGQLKMTKRMHWIQSIKSLEEKL